MTMFLNLSFTYRAMFGLWSLILCLAGIVGFALSIALRRYRTVMLSLLAFALPYLMWQTTVCFLYLPESEQTSRLCLWLGRLPYIVWVPVLLIFTTITAIVFYSIRRYSRNVITPLTIERCADELSCGICYWQDNGHVIFSNDCMNTLGIQLTGRPLMDGKRLREAITDTIMPVGNRAWQFTFRDGTYGQEVLHELIASDVSALYAESGLLKEDNERLAKLNEELRVYGLKLDETVRRQEMLQAKVNIHDEMNRLMLSTMATDLDNDEELNRIFALWERNALLLCMESNEHGNEDAVNQLNEFARTLGVRILWKNELPQRLTLRQRELFFAAAYEAITNAVKHAQAKNMTLSFMETETRICCTFENDGIIPQGEITFSGGLVNLSILAEEQQAIVSAEAGDTFRLSLIFSENR